VHGESNRPGRLPESLPAGSRAAALTVQRQLDALLEAIGALVDRAIDRTLLTGERVTSADEGKRLLAGTADAEAFADNIQRVVVLAVPVVRALARGARFTRVPLVMVASASVSIGLTLRSGVREVQVIGALVTHRLEQATGTPADPALVKRLAVELYLEPKRTPDLGSDRLRLLRLTRRWVLRGALGRDTSRHARRALDAAERLDARAAHSAWTSRHERSGRSPGAGGLPR
jgi:hypothetical protein